MPQEASAPPSAFFTIPLEHLEPTTVLGFDVYLQRGQRGPILYRSRELEFTHEIRERLLERGVVVLMVPAEQAEAYHTYRLQHARAPESPRPLAPPPSQQELRIHEVLKDERRPLRPRCSTLLGVSRAVVQVALSDLSSPGLGERIDRVAEATARFLLSEPSAYPVLVSLLELDLDTYSHSTHVALYTTELARAVGMADPLDLTAIGRAALLHDIGKGQLPIELIHREGPTSPAERALIESHVTRGVELLRDAGFSEPVGLDVCAHHHERCDRSGYPEGLPREEISIQARVVAIADAFDALTSSGRRRAALSGFQALWRMKRHMEGKFDPELLDVFIRVMVEPSSRN